jgi:hypothetical protein
VNAAIANQPQFGLPPTPTPLPGVPPKLGLAPPTGVNLPGSVPPMAGGPSGPNTPTPLGGGGAPPGGGIGAPPSPIPLATSPTAATGATPPGGSGAPPPGAGPSAVSLATSPSANPYANATTNVPGSSTDLTNKTITPGAGVDRLALAKSNFQNFQNSTEPGYQADLRDANTAGYGSGQGGSGMLRGRLGDIGTARTLQLQTAANQNVNDATAGSIGDQYANIGIAQQQQQSQIGQEGTAFGQGVTQAQLGNDLTNSAFNRAATTTAMGEQGNPSDVGLALSGYYGNQAGQAGQAAGSLVGNSVLANSLGRNPYMQWPQQPPAGQT